MHALLEPAIVWVIVNYLFVSMAIRAGTYRIAKDAGWFLAVSIALWAAAATAP